MTHLLDTDVLSIWQTGAGLEYTMLALRMSAHPDVGVSVVSFHEQMIGANAYLNRGRTGADLIAGYGRLDRLRKLFAPLALVPFDDPAAFALGRLKAAKVRVGSMDLRIAAVALSRNPRSSPVTPATSARCPACGSKTGHTDGPHHFASNSSISKTSVA